MTDTHTKGKKSKKLKRDKDSVKIEDEELDKLSSLFGLSSMQTTQCIIRMLIGFVFNTTQHSEFDKIWQETWLSFGFPTYNLDLEGSLVSDRIPTNVTRRMVEIPSEPNIEMIRICHDAKTIGRFMIKRNIAICLITSIISGDHWRNSIDLISSIPASIHQSMMIHKVNIQNVFPKINGKYDEFYHDSARDLPLYISKVICLNRFVYHKHMIENVGSDNIQNKSYEDIRYGQKNESIEEEESAYIEDSSSSSGSDDSEDITPFPRAVINNTSTSDLQQQNKSKVDDTPSVTYEHTATGLLMAIDDVVIIRKQEMIVEGYDTLYNNRQITKKTTRTKDEAASYHPYTFSMTIFSLSVEISEKITEETNKNEWPPSKVYFYLKDYLAGQVSVFGQNPPKVLLHYAENILLFVSNAPRSNIDSQIVSTIHKFLSLYSNAPTMLYKHLRYDIDDIRKPVKGKLIPFKELSDSEFNELTNTKFYGYHSPTTDRESGLFNCQCGRYDCKPKVLTFSRDIVSPIQLHCSLELLERHLVIKHSRAIAHHNGMQLWNIAFTEDKVILMIERTFINVISKHIPFLLCKNQTIARNIPFPTYYIHLHNYAYGDPFNLVVSIKYIAKLFWRAMYGYSIGTIDHYMPTDDSDPLISYYRILHMILARFPSKDVLLDEIIDPLRDDDLLIFKEYKSGKRKLTALKANKMTIYSAMKAFVLIYCQHYISANVVAKLEQLFLEKPDLQSTHIMAHRLIRHLSETAQSNPMEFIPIPLDTSTYGEKDTQIPPHVILYYLCISNDLSDEIAISLFKGMNIYSRNQSWGHTVKDSIVEQIKLPNFLPNKRVLDKHSSLLINSSVEYRERIQKSRLVRPKGFDALDFVMQTMEELMYYHTKNLSSIQDLCTDPSYRGNVQRFETYVPLTSDEILADETSPPSLPVDCTYDRKPVCWDRCIPVWKCSMYDSMTCTVRWKNIISKVGQNSHSAFVTSPVCKGDSDAIPFTGCHPDLMECIVLQPIVVIDALSSWDIENVSGGWSLPDTVASLEEDVTILPIDSRALKRTFKSMDERQQQQQTENVKDKFDTLRERFSRKVEDRASFGPTRKNMTLFNVHRALTQSMSDKDYHIQI